ncbi:MULTISPECIES: 3-hydroxyacyl-ACP dehydratase FabZ [Pasteurellaceae]|uniref:3-hydroxyacyl-[acyl-carrier-protein] dehydratase FabZ n=1 Tax=Pasteurella atlantica TaxID=2827233 RepID=A0AAW8CI52_9PAST|nr:3-hydroxyacyl-ACP dehydratase FabZ [Pasteurella atlantica]MBR0573732.1 3-hydroxyacyl-ACP dehydratase FabZ [Pasteurella atlantica]MDP8039633.1 3-hydroxyacyl-ACP dehydratase FabZ [Pasteurella atlantica]MDP8041724.1 3-hydroxyacyl-ACP dehydratase FabZ [Pasteurella atlantica]MDP8044002.1 3-hydroxyacyl-ACP dehydratase FabZ [Pasteurella atlantica]MDP8045980.1 3-hydroxyacyl-ACP dehydratase FabZ [Pasteurella atlantica]
MEQQSRESRIIETTEIMELLPHRYPFLLVDRVIDFEEGKWIKAIKNVTANEPCFTGHFPKQPIFPGVLIMESLAQAMGILAFKTHQLEGGEIFYFAGINNARFKKPVLPGDQMKLQVNILKEMRGVIRFTGTVTVEGKTVCEAELMCARRQS